MTEEREHITTGTDCWCGPVCLSYGDQLIYDEDGNLLDVSPGDDDTHEDDSTQDDEAED